ncbi:amidohydrolase family protein [Bryobacter aggregatus]|uniref:amidohydrolase family protein n=1 Tax=Bryobacter aggregatus TaxID=360054 RepID=UPI00068F670C|nr:amidohydrolase family protein [Bryobacter aggregatus]
MRFALPLCLLAASVFASEKDSFFLKGITVFPVSGPKVENTTLLVVDGKIAEIGAKIAPKGVRVIDGKGLQAYPGLINSATNIGLSEISSIRETNDTGELGDFNPQLRAIVAINPETEHIPVVRANGITTVLTLPGTGGSGGGASGIIQGQAALIHLDGYTFEEMEINRSAAYQMRFPSMQSRAFDFDTFQQANGSFADAKRRYEAQMQEVKHFFSEARAYMLAKNAKTPGLRVNLKYDAMIPVLEGKAPVMIAAGKEREIRAAIAFAEAEKIKIILADVREPGKAVELIAAKKIPCILGPVTQLPPEADMTYDYNYALPAQLHKAGVKFAFGSFQNQFARNIMFEAASASAYGLPYPEALKALTLNAAEIFGVGDKYGSLEKGKYADLLVTNGDPLEVKTEIKMLFIQGRPQSLESKHTRLYEKYRARPN